MGGSVGVGVNVIVGVADGSKAGVDVLVMGETVCMGMAVVTGAQLNRKTTNSKIVRAR